MSTALTHDVDDISGGRYVPRWESTTTVSAVSSALILATIAAVGGWMRRWISDDGLIVLRTVRNLLAGNGPVFNAGERVETNTSTLWQYLIYVVGLVSDARLETIALWLGLILTTAALLIAALATAGFYRGRPGLILLPVGGLVYLAIPAARDFATSGLEWGLSIFWLAVQWALLVAWVRPADRGARHGRAAADWAPSALAFWSGLSWLVRPELALYGALTGILLLVAARTWRVGLGILAAALPVPAAYQIFRMGYYGVLTPHTAVAKSATGAEWGAGWDYVLDLATPYNLFLAMALVVVVAAALLWRAAAAPALQAPAAGRLRARTRTAAAAVLFGAGALHLLYVIRVGGDFMHGRMLLLPLFAILLPITVAPLVDLAARRWVIDGVLLLAGIGIVVWALVVMANGTNRIDMHTYETGELNIVDEREFWTNATRREAGDPPRLAEDFLKAPAVGDWEDSVDEAMAEDPAQMIQIIVTRDPATYSWTGAERMSVDSDLGDIPTTVYLLNLGMTGMNSPLDLRVLDTVGLSSPLAARQPREEGGRIGHDKWLPLVWQAADTDADLGRLPSWIDPKEAMLARAALRSPEISELLATSREPMSRERFLANIAYSLGEGRSLEISRDPRDHLDEATIKAVEEAARAAEDNPDAADEVPGTTDADGGRVAWLTETRIDDRW